MNARLAVSLGMVAVLGAPLFAQDVPVAPSPAAPAAAASPGSAAAASPAPASPAFGIGVDQSYRLTLAFMLGRTLRVQPEVGYTGLTSTIPAYMVLDVAYPSTQLKQSQLLYGLGLYLVRAFPIGSGGESIVTYAGPRGGATVHRGSVSGTELHQTDWWVGVAAGGEYLIARHFGVGAEAQITKAFAGTPSGGTSGPYGFAFTTTELETRGIVVIRVYPF